MFVSSGKYRRITTQLKWRIQPQLELHYRLHPRRTEVRFYLEHSITNRSSRDFSIINALVFAVISGLVSSIYRLSVNCLQFYFIRPPADIGNIKFYHMFVVDDIKHFPISYGFLY